MPRLLPALACLALALVGSAAASDQPPPPGWTPVEDGASPTETGRWRDGPVRPRGLTDGTAYTVPRGSFRVGLFRQSWGALDNWELGTSAGLVLLGLPTLNTKITAIQAGPVEAAFRGGVTWIDLERTSGVAGATASWVPLGGTVSWRATESLGLHLGATWSRLSLRGDTTPAQLTTGLAAASGVELDPATLDVLDQLGDDVGLYGAADLVLSQTHATVDWHLNRRDSIVLRATALTSLSGRVVGAVQTTADDSGVQTSVGPSAELHVPLRDAVSLLASVSWQWSWERLHLRVGLPLPVGNTWVAAVPQAFSLHWVLGPRDRARQAADGTLPASEVSASAR